MVLETQRHLTSGLTRVLAWPFIVLRVPPNAITVFTLVPATLTAWLLWQEQWYWALAAGVVTASTDFLDGAVARATGKTSTFGGFLDSVVDRYVDVILLMGIGLALDHVAAWTAVGAALIGSLGTSYARARALQDVPDAPPDTWNQLMERPERIIFLGVGVLGQALATTFGYPWDILYWVLVVYAVATNLTVVQRVVKARRIMAEKGI